MNVSLLSFVDLYTPVLATAEHLLDNGAEHAAGEGLHPSAKGAGVRFGDGGPTVSEGPFDRTGLVAGFWLWNVGSMQDAIDWLKRAPFGGGEELEIRPLFAVEDFGEALTPELREQEERLRARMGG